ncbi:MAG: GIY-YIG nuclease family protein [Woeseiaceae bacterium]|nr:GIY-YIG nuclease family protein [Woeseiaceae bacterium]
MPESGASSPDYSLYILRCADGSLYTGIAIDVDSRLVEHESGRRGAKYLRGRAPFRLVFKAQVGDRSEAQRAEYRVKRLDRAEKLRLIAGELSLGALG